MNQDREIDIDPTISLLYLGGGILAFGIPFFSYLTREVSGEPMAEIGDGFYILFIYLFSFCYLVFSMISSGIGWYASERLSAKKAFKWVFGISVFLLALLLAHFFLVFW